jgi:hypothetical protein
MHSHTSTQDMELCWWDVVQQSRAVGGERRQPEAVSPPSGEPSRIEATRVDVPPLSSPGAAAAEVAVAPSAGACQTNMRSCASCYLGQFVLNWAGRCIKDFFITLKDVIVNPMKRFYKLITSLQLKKGVHVFGKREALLQLLLVSRSTFNFQLHVSCVKTARLQYG